MSAPATFQIPPKSVSSPTQPSLFSFGSHQNARNDQEYPISPLTTTTPTSPRTTQSNSRGKMHQRSYTTSKFEVKETNTMCKDYDPVTGNKRVNKYMLIKEVGRGVHGKVKLGRDMETGELVAIKIVDRTSRKRLGQRHNELSNEQKIRKEIAILKKCAHPHVVRLIEVIDDPMSKKIYMVLEYMEGGEIRWKDENNRPVLSTEEARRIFREVVLGLEYLHHQGIIHRDIKPANLLLTVDGVVKISDFGVSYFSQRANTASIGSEKGTTIQDSELTKTAGSPAFFAPELCFPGDISLDLSQSGAASALFSSEHSNASKQSSNTSLRLQRPPITKAIDVWALGVTLYCFIFGRCPFIADTEFELFFNIIPKKPLEFPDDVKITDDLKYLLTRLLEKDAAKRITLEEVKRLPWVTSGLPNPGKWREETDPKKYQAVTVTDEEVKSAYTLIGRLKKKFRQISVSLGHLTLGNLRRRSKSVSEASIAPIDNSSYSASSVPTQTSEPISIRPSYTSNDILEVNQHRHESIYGSSFPETYAWRRSREVENYEKYIVHDDTRSVSSSSSLSVATSATSDRVDLHHSVSARHLGIGRQNNRSHSGLKRTWTYGGKTNSFGERTVQNKDSLNETGQMDNTDERIGSNNEEDRNESDKISQKAE